LVRTPGPKVAKHSTSQTSQREPDGRKWILAATILGSSLAFIDSTVVNVALPALQSGFQTTVANVQWVIESYGLFLGALILVGGSLGDLFGRRLVFIVGVGTFALASVACGLAQSIQQLIIARSVQGIGAAMLVPGSLAIISATFDEKTRGQAIGTWSGFTAITTAVGPVMGGWMVEHWSWRAVFFINFPLALSVVAISFWKIPESRSHLSQRVDWIGALLATLGLGGVIAGFVEAGALGWHNLLIYSSLIAGVVLIIAFVLFEAKAEAPMFPLNIFRSSSFAGANLLTLFLYSAIGIFFFLFPLDLIQVQGYSTTATGAALLPFIVLMFLLSRWSGGLVAKYGAKPPLVIGPVIAALGFASFALPATASNYWTSFFPAMLVLGFGMAVTVAPLTTVVMSSVDEDRAGAASGVNNAVARVAGVLAVAVFGTVMIEAFGWRLSRNLGDLHLRVETVQFLLTNQSRLAALQAPAGLDPASNSAIKQAVAKSFVFGFQIVMLICSGLAIASALIARKMVGSDHRRPI
jgi:EmrB/QacA subfamily drug resistance transporter